MRIGNVPIRIDGARVTAMDVARRAGVSQPTVSLVLSNSVAAGVADGGSPPSLPLSSSSPPHAATTSDAAVRTAIQRDTVRDLR